MARGFRPTKPERAAIKHAIEYTKLHTAFSKGELKAADSVLEKLVACEAPQVKSRSGLLVRDAITAFRSVIDRRLIAPPAGANGLFAQMQNRLNALGLTYEQCVTIATQANTEWKSGNIKVESLIRQAEVLLAHADGQYAQESRETAQPVEMDGW